MLRGRIFLRKYHQLHRLCRRRRKKRKRERKSRCERRNDKAAAENEGGARLVKGTHGGGPGDRACLARAVASLLKGELKEAFLIDALKAIPSDRDPCPADLAPVLTKHGFALVRASKITFDGITS